MEYKVRRMKIGKCPKCGNVLDGTFDIETRKIKGGTYSHFAFVCKKCGHIIGFAARESA